MKHKNMHTGNRNKSASEQIVALRKAIEKHGDADGSRAKRIAELLKAVK